MATCWECGRETPTTLPATLRLASGALRHFQLCPLCFRIHYLPLLAEVAGEADRAEPKRPRPQRRTGRTHGP